jgi:hypothetical protein
MGFESGRFGAIRGLSDLVNKDKREQEEKEAEFKRDFNEIMGRHFNVMPDITFASKIDGVNSIRVIPPELAPDQKELRSVNVVVYYNHEGKGKEDNTERYFTFSLTPDGNIVRKIEMPSELKEKEMSVTGEMIIRELMADFKEADLFGGDVPWIDYDDKSSRQMFSGGEGGVESDGEGGKKETTGWDPERLKLLQKQKNLRLIFSFSSRGGFDGYAGFVFEKLLVMEHPEIGNAAYLIDLPEPILRTELPKDRKELKQWLGKQEWTKRLTTRRLDLLTSGGTRIIHNPGDNWQEKMRVEIENRQKRKGAPAESENSDSQ